MGRKTAYTAARQKQLDAGRALIASPLRGGVYLDAQQLRIMAAVEPRDLDRFSADDRRLMQAAIIRVRTHTRALEAGLEFAETLNLEVTGSESFEISAETQLAFTAALTELYIAAGELTEALTWAERLLALVHDDIDPLWQEQAFGIAAAVYVYCGQFDRADELLNRMSQIASAQGWDPHRLSYFQASAYAMMSFSRMDSTWAKNVRPHLKALVEAEPIAASLAHTIKALDLMFEGETDAAIALALQVSQGVLHPDGPEIVRLSALGIASICLVLRGTPQQALALLQDAESPTRHFICLNVIRSSAYIQLQDYRGALLVTDECMRMRNTHVPFTMPAVLTRRAIANHQMGHLTAALHDASDALHAADLAYPAGGILGLPPNKVEALGVALLLRHPRFARKVAKIRTILPETLPTTPPTFSYKLLSKREQLVATRLRKGMQYAEIAAELHVTPGTIKVQSHSIQKKTGTKSREEAVAFLERAGFYDAPPPPR